MVKHLNKKKKCIKRPIVYVIDDTKLYNDSLIKIYNNEEKADEGKADDEKINDMKNNYMKNNDINEGKINNEEDKDEIIESTSEDSSEKYICKKCNKIFSRKYTLTRHNLKNCKIINENDNNNENNNTNILNNNSYNTSNNTNNIETQNIINFNFNLMKSFNEQWDVSSMDNFLKLALMLSSNKYTNTLKSILENDNNLNVIFDKNNEYGLIYNKEDKKFTNMKINEIIELSMEKLNKHLEEFHNEISESLKNVNLNIDPEIIEIVKDKIDKKYTTYKKNNEVKNGVNNIISDIFNEKYDYTKEICNKLLVNTESEGY
jgi:hypothetical protein